MSNKSIRILGIDPGIAITGWGVVDFDGNQCKTVSYGAIITKSEELMEDRLNILFEDLVEVINEFSPAVVAIEQLFFFKNSKTIITVGEARGVILLASKRSKLGIFEYTPLQIKQAVTGYGRANKNQMQQMIKDLLKLEEVPRPDDVADALAVAYTYSVYNNNFKFEK